MPRHSLIIIILLVFSFDANACVMPDFEQIGYGGGLVIFVCSLIAVLLRTRTNKRKIWVPLSATVLISLMLVPFFYMFTPIYFYDNCGDGAFETMKYILIVAGLMPMYELSLFIKSKFNKKSVVDAKNAQHN
ncbi:MAG: hypothetical protein KUG78_18735 [Kangiellaceae bacterium]|nr:hypothetical protein [Kangiellaceae bacterium]